MLMNAVSAKKKLRNHLRRRSKEEFPLSENIAAYWWTVLNRAVFKGKLTPASFKIKKMSDCEGRCEALDHFGPGVLIKIDRCSAYSRQQLIEILAHEMVHQWQWENYRQMNHKQSFVFWKKRLFREFAIRI
jgi:hypothetical protein